MLITDSNIIIILHYFLLMFFWLCHSKAPANSHSGYGYNQFLMDKIKSRFTYLNVISWKYLILSRYSEDCTRKCLYISTH